MTTPDSAVELFEEHRADMVGAAYRILGTRTDAEDVVQDAWLRWSGADLAEVQNPRAYLLTIASRLALNRLRQQATHRESYVGPWLPEPVPTEPDPRTDGARAAELADQVSMAMLVVLESLSPLERAAFVLTEVFAMSAPEVAEALDRSPAAVRQLVRRARSHVEARQPRHVVDAARHRRVTEKFLEAAVTGDLDGVLALLAPDVVLVSDGGGIRQAALRPIHSASKVARWLFGVIAKQRDVEIGVDLRTLNGETAVVLTADGAVDSVGFLTVEDDRITAIHLVRNPEKLRLL